MNEERILRYVAGDISDKKEREEIRNWIDSDAKNKRHFTELKNAYVLSRKDSRRLDLEKEYLKLQKKILVPQKRIIEFAKYVAVVFLSFGLSWVIYKSNTSQVMDMAALNEVFCPEGQISELVLSDGTRVWLNSGSKIAYPACFNMDDRTVVLEGEAYFEVSKNEKNPFIVKTKTLDVKVLGTQFNIEAYGDEFETTLVEGKVELQNKKGKTVTEMYPGQQASFARESKKITLSDVDTHFYSSWKEEKMTFFDEPLEKLVPKLERWYNVKFKFDDEEIKSYRFSSTILKSKPLDQILQIITLSSSINFKIIQKPDDKNEIILTKKNKKPM